MMEIAWSAVQQQKLFISPQLRQSMEILHMSSLDLNEYIQEQSSDNPFIEWNAKDFKRKVTPPTAKNNADWWLNFNSKTVVTLESVLEEQINYLTLDKMTYELCQLIIGCLDEKGYLIHEKEWIAEYKQVSLEKVQFAVQIIQGLEPSGIASSSLEECLLIQLEHRNEMDPLVHQLVQYELANIAKGKLQPLAKKFNVDVSDIQNAVDIISQLNPKPGSMFSKDKTQYIIPDLVLRKKDNTFEIIFEEEAFPVISLNSCYINMMKQHESKDVTRFLNKKWKMAKSMQHCIENRKRTIFKVASVIFEKQIPFCEKGPAYIQPMSMKQVADILQIHDSTVSRAVNNKYVMTHWGLFGFRHFFSSSIKQSDGDSVSALHLKDRIRKIINDEQKTNPLSDQKVADLLQTEGIMISRRTVTKYREQMNLFPAAQRKRYSI